MINKPLIAGVIGFLAGGLLVSIAATTFDKPQANNSAKEMSMTQMTDKLKPLQGDEFDKAFLEHMIAHHQGAIDMAKLVETNGKHEELKKLGQDILSAQSKEIGTMQTWQTDWGYKNIPMSHDMHGM
jgi:uncharacterized protein (DUF305 family)